MKNISGLLASICIALLLVAAGCETETKTKTTVSDLDLGDGAVHVHSDGTTHDHSVAGHAHGAGPHEGTVADWGGGKFHVELTVDHDKKEATVYVLGGDEKTAVPIDASEVTLTIKEPSLTIALKATPEDGDPEGKSSRFVGSDEGLSVVQDYEGSISGVVEETPYSGKFKEEIHEE